MDAEGCDSESHADQVQAHNHGTILYHNPQIHWGLCLGIQQCSSSCTAFHDRSALCSWLSFPALPVPETCTTDAVWVQDPASLWRCNFCNVECGATASSHAYDLALPLAACSGTDGEVPKTWPFNAVSAGRLVLPVDYRAGVSLVGVPPSDFRLWPRSKQERHLDGLVGQQVTAALYQPLSTHDAGSLECAPSLCVSQVIFKGRVA
jgi:hypothetical protein